jgi:hypothetical protein
MIGRRRGATVDRIAFVVSSVICVTTLAYAEWIEAVFRIDADGGNGVVEWLVGVLTFAATVIFTISNSRMRRSGPKLYGEKST